MHNVLVRHAAGSSYHRHDLIPRKAPKEAHCCLSLRKAGDSISELQGRIHLTCSTAPLQCRLRYLLEARLLLWPRLVWHCAQLNSTQCFPSSHAGHLQIGGVPCCTCKAVTVSACSISIQVQL